MDNIYTTQASSLYRAVFEVQGLYPIRRNEHRLLGRPASSHSKCIAHDFPRHAGEKEEDIAL